MSKNEITGDEIATKAVNDLYRDGFDRIWGKPTDLLDEFPTGVKCSDHPDAPHGFLRQASHAAGRYVCECEGWKPDKYSGLKLVTKEPGMKCLAGSEDG